MPEVKTLTPFDPSKPVYCIKQFFYGVNKSSIRYASDHPLRLDQIPVEYRTKEYIYQGKIRSTGRQMIEPQEEDNNNLIASDTFGVQEEVSTATANLLKIGNEVDDKGNPLPQSATTSQRRAARAKAKEKAEAATTKKSTKG